MNPVAARHLFRVRGCCPGHAKAVAVRPTVDRPSTRRRLEGDRSSTGRTGLIVQVACGGGASSSSGGGASGGTPAGNYAITITGTLGSTQHSTTTTLTVQ
jgi:hypothetical protein